MSWHTGEGRGEKMAKKVIRFEGYGRHMEPENADPVHDPDRMVAKMERYHNKKKRMMHLCESEDEREREIEERRAASLHRSNTLLIAAVVVLALLVVTLLLMKEGLL